MIDPRVFQQMISNQQQLQAFQQQFQAFQQQFQGGPNTINAQQMVMQNLQNGTMSQDDFNRCSMMANQLMGQFFYERV